MAVDSQYVKIGCVGYPLEYWLKNYEKIGGFHKYDYDMIKRYGIQLKSLKEMVK